ncbi:MAG TPA: metallophosphoesterase [Ktedonobacteraceae bacterium]|nr:metallophosphoesterase [Ktedonobacteraceae bacterium]
MISQNSKESPASTLEALSEFAERDQLEPPETYKAALAAALALLSQEDGLLQLPDLPTIIIPDLHARRLMLIAILGAQLAEGPHAGRRIFDLLQQGLINVVCVGDIVHSEERDDWVINRDGEWTEELLEKEMVRSLGAGAMMMYLKVQYPEHFHCLRGNHDDMAGELAEDFRKFVGLKFDEHDELVFVDGRPVVTGDKGESRLVREWVLSREGWGQPFLQTWAQFERSLPVFAQATYFVVSHTPPLVPLSEAEIREASKSREISLELTSRRGINEEAIRGTLKNLGLAERVERWFHGHSRVPREINGGKYEESLDGLVVRLNNPKKHVFAYVPASYDERHFDPTRDVYIKSPLEEAFHR